MMKTIVVDDEPIMIRSFLRQSAEIEALNVIGTFEDSRQALEFARENRVDLAVLDIAMPGMTGLELAKELRRLTPEILIVFITAYDSYIRDSNQLGADDYIVKPYKSRTLMQMAEKMLLLAKRQQKPVYIQTFGRFLVTQNGKPVPLSGKAKEILALVVTRRGREISNEEIYTTLWEGRPYSNVEMKVYYNALRRLRDALGAAGLSELLLSTTRGQVINTDLFDCDYYDWLDHDSGRSNRFQGQFLSEYSWSESLLADMLRENW